ncbi:hypothetical protein PSN45_000934 [Yamadazyma tenuis]|uniref:Uncharacterized protein n=1 Tax=Candida tenuis (strain ATCC 10573 / BCRC 21748 / CBS 615 / JCM 9827 / NBRC 10315 / NRRL Y-1498 / VKM Y-70) TaxID=590646 RepID=G3BBQ6_CANTC|nr:uncharacterized protein CANTEDRAFT_136148 [Yamadazyma tenuis ATCC 10573]EGV62210.1 hypothetical protein CANTEDRAFT_136148 [Yamadazyma tenuis ATCC 10573]WEJ93470.1 hypothetical protein PSN45_000934 [Yamadazyma tenuis]
MAKTTYSIDTLLSLKTSQKIDLGSKLDELFPPDLQQPGRTLPQKPNFNPRRNRFKTPQTPTQTSSLDLISQLSGYENAPVRFPIPGVYSYPITVCPENMPFAPNCYPGFLQLPAGSRIVAVEHGKKVPQGAIPVPPALLNSNFYGPYPLGIPNMNYAPQEGSKALRWQPLGFQQASPAPKNTKLSRSFGAGHPASMPIRVAVPAPTPACEPETQPAADSLSTKSYVSNDDETVSTLGSSYDSYNIQIQLPKFN